MLFRASASSLDGRGARGGCVSSPKPSSSYSSSTRGRCPQPRPIPPALARARRATAAGLPSPSRSLGATTGEVVCVLRNMSDRPMPYEDVWVEQKRLVEAKAEQIEEGTPIAQDLFLVQHQSVYTLGAGSTTKNLLFDEDDPPFPLYRTERGGEVTFHGPGQLVLYPILDLRSFQQDLHWYLRTLEEVVIRMLAHFGLKGERVSGMTGVWVDGKKVAAIGVRAKRWITYHGLAVNITMDLSPYEKIVPCGIQDRGVTTLFDLLADRDPPRGGKREWETKEDLLEEAKNQLLESFADLFGVQYVHM